MQNSRFLALRFLTSRTLTDQSPVNLWIVEVYSGFVYSKDSKAISNRADVVLLACI